MLGYVMNFAGWQVREAKEIRQMTQPNDNVGKKRKVLKLNSSIFDYTKSPIFAHLSSVIVPWSETLWLYKYPFEYVKGFTDKLLCRITIFKPSQFLKFIFQNLSQHFIWSLNVYNSDQIGIGPVICKEWTINYAQSNKPTYTPLLNIILLFSLKFIPELIFLPKLKIFVHQRLAPRITLNLQNFT